MGNGTNSASWTFDSLEAGKNYQLYATWTAEGNRASNAPFTVLDGNNSLEECWKSTLSSADRFHGGNVSAHQGRLRLTHKPVVATVF
jgi:hypothetical protein